MAGYQYSTGPRLEEAFAPGQPLALVREPDNPHDHLAVRIDWRCRKLGYVLRPQNADIAARLIAGEVLSARIMGFDPKAELWQRVEFVVEAAGIEPASASPLQSGLHA